MKWNEMNDKKLKDKYKLTDEELNKVTEILHDLSVNEKININDYIISDRVSKCLIEIFVEIAKKKCYKMNNSTTEDNEPSDEKILSDALIAAKIEFFKHIEEYSVDGAFFDIELSGFILDINFERMHKISMKSVQNLDT
ncbi:MAG: hypothetical protein KAS32_02255 [Candidatus Peribacteraceae bacterium]|nr:hypothetical protein [Candidatus Peribacteraceae bacterium]